jgi:hypothetical protein
MKQIFDKILNAGHQCSLVCPLTIIHDNALTFPCSNTAGKYQLVQAMTQYSCFGLGVHLHQVHPQISLIAEKYYSLHAVYEQIIGDPVITSVSNNVGIVTCRLLSVDGILSIFEINVVIEVCTVGLQYVA